MANVQNFTNSSLVSYTKISPNKTKNRTHIIDTITIHCVVGQCSVETLGTIFANPTRLASSNYGIGFDGRIGMYVEEKDRSWCSSNSANDNRAVTIEVASDTTHPYAVKNEAYESLIKLVADICKRNNIKELKWKADKSLIGQIDKQNMTVHRWFKNKACPGDYLYNRHGEIADRVNKMLGVTASESNIGTKPNSEINVNLNSNVNKTVKFNIGGTVKLVSGATYYDGKSIPSWLFKVKLYVRSINGDKITISTQKTGAITGNVNIKYLVDYETGGSLASTATATATITTATATSTNTTFKLGDTVKLISGATYYDGKAIPSWLFKIGLYARAINGDKITVSTQKTGAITGNVNIKYLVKY